MKIGVIFPCNEIGGDNGAIRAYVQAVEDLGYGHIEVFDHVVGEPDNYAGRLWREPFVLLSWMAAMTERIELTTGIVILPQRQTALAAKQAADLDMLSDGRLRFGLGVGWNPFEYTALNQDFTRRGRRLDEQIDALRLLWSGAVTDMDVEIGNEHVHGGGINPPPTRKIPLWIGGRSPAALRRAVGRSQGWLSNFQDCLENDREDFLAAKRQLADAAGGSVPRNFGIETWTTPTRTDQATWAPEASEWRRLGVTHLSLRTDESRNNVAQGPPRSVDEHIDILGRYQEEVGDLRNV